MRTVHIDLDSTPSECAQSIDGAIYLENDGVDPSGEQYRAAMALLDGARTELAAMAARADERARQMAEERMATKRARQADEIVARLEDKR